MATGASSTGEVRPVTSVLNYYLPWGLFWRSFSVRLYHWMSGCLFCPLSCGHKCGLTPPPQLILLCWCLTWFYDSFDCWLLLCLPFILLWILCCWHFYSNQFIVKLLEDPKQNGWVGLFSTTIIITLCVGGPIQATEFRAFWRYTT